MACVRVWPFTSLLVDPGSPWSGGVSPPVFLSPSLTGVGVVDIRRSTGWSWKKRQNTSISSLDIFWLSVKLAWRKKKYTSMTQKFSLKINHNTLRWQYFTRMVVDSGQFYIHCYINTSCKVAEVLSLILKGAEVRSCPGTASWRRWLTVAFKRLTRLLLHSLVIGHLVHRPSLILQTLQGGNVQLWRGV